MQGLRRYGVVVLFGLVGLLMTGYGTWQIIRPTSPVVEIVKDHESKNGGQEEVIFVDVAGAVEVPGVYKLASGARIGDALIAAGGIAAEADREWVAKTLNLAEEVRDGRKIYIPKIRESQEQPPVSQLTKQEGTGKINVNTASLGELESLAGIGAARANAIVSNRPYAEIKEIVSKAKIPESVYENIKDQIRVY